MFLTKPEEQITKNKDWNKLYNQLSIQSKWKGLQAASITNKNIKCENLNEIRYTN